jgi:hypothetical protein
MQDKHFSPDYVSDGGRFVKTTYCAKGGDSGAAVFRDNRAYGIHSGGATGSCRQAGDFSLFGHIEYVENALNVSLVKG